ncbi:MAG: L,D-transpeptidase family protein [Deltaproteobacteria bacterium]|nr:L,D-transpeptidase family protein [Deltaproteobacteria bacterium]
MSSPVNCAFGRRLLGVTVPGLAALATIASALTATGCAPATTGRPRPAAYRTATHRVMTPLPPDASARENGLPTTAAYETQPIMRITAVTVRVPESWETPPLVGRLQHHRVVAGENLLELARAGGLGFREVRDANPTIDEWEPRAGVDILLPSRSIVPRTSYRGLVINIPEMRLYFFPTDAMPGERVPVLTWPIGIGAEEAPSPVGAFTVKSKDENPTWVVPASILRTMEHPQAVVPPGPDNPLGDYRIRLSIDVYAIHGTNDPWTVGRLTTHGCIRLYPEDIATLYPLVESGTPGEIVYQPVKFGRAGGHVYVEVHQDVYQMYPDLERYAFRVLAESGLADRVDAELVRTAVRVKTGVPTDVTRGAPPRGVSLVHTTAPEGDV